MTMQNDSQQRPGTSGPPIYGAGQSTVAESSAAKSQVKRASMYLLWTIAIFFVVAFAWIAIAEVDTVTRADGRVMPSAKMQVVQNLEGGIVTAILVKQGQTVNAGDRLVTLSAVQLDADQKSRNQQLLALEARAARAVALANGQQPKFPKAVVDFAPDLMAAEMAAFVSKQLEQESQVSVLLAQIDQKKRELEEAQVTLRAARAGVVLAREERATVAH